MGSQNISIPVGTATATIASGSGRLLWHSFRETTGAASAEYHFYDGQAPDRLIVLPINLAASESTRDYMGRHGVPFMRGLYFILDSGSVEGNVVIELSDPRVEQPLPIVIVESLATILTTPGNLIGG